MSKKTILKTVTGLMLIVASFIGGKWYGRITAEGQSNNAFILVDDTVVVTDGGRENGSLPKGTVLYKLSQDSLDEAQVYKIYVVIRDMQEHPVRINKIDLNGKSAIYTLKAK